MCALNPLLIGPVLRCLAMHLEHPELKSGRLVCSAWASEFQVHFAARSKVKVVTIAARGYAKVAHLIRHIESTNNVFFTSLVLVRALCSSSTGLWEIRRLMDICTGHLTELHFKDKMMWEITWDDMQEFILRFRRNLLRCTICLPNSTKDLSFKPTDPVESTSSPISGPLFPELKSIRLNRSVNPNFLRRMSDKEMYSFLRNLFRNMPKLQEVTLDVESGRRPTAALYALKNSKCSLNLTCLQVAGIAGLASLTAILSLTQNAPNLKVLKFFYWENVYQQECRKTLIDIMKCCQSNLEEFQVVGLDFKQHKRWIFRKDLRTGVKSIRIVPGSKIVFWRFALAGIDILQYADGSNALDKETKKETKISSWEYSTVAESLLECLSYCYPDAVSLRVDIAAAGVLILWSWRQLRVLNVSIKLSSGGEQMNLCMLGITEEELERLQKHLDRKILTDVQLERCRSSIVDLRDLKFLTIKFERNTTCSLDPTGYFGLAKMTWLETLTMSLGEDCLSIDCQDYIRKSLTGSTVKFA